MTKYMSMDNLRFLLRDVHGLSEILHFDRYQDYDADSVDILLKSTKDWTDKDFYPYFKEMDEKPAYYEDGKVITHPQLVNVMKYAGENGYIGSTFDYDHGGMQMPHIVHLAVNHILESSNNHLPGYMGLTGGAAHLITSFGSQELIDKYVPTMIAGKWAGTMALTEPQAGSSLSDIKTSATPTDDGVYKIKGQKIFISGGDQTASENIIHLLLARIEGAPGGTRGISLFVVPKYRIDEEGKFESNDVITAGDFQKLGQRGYSTVHLSMGEKDDCLGWLVGEPHKGLKYMFQMMNGARIDVGMTAVSTATAAYYASLQYAHERPQGRKLQSTGKKDANSDQVLIINHPDVRRMLFLQKAIIEGSLSLLMHCGRLSDIHHNESAEVAENAHDLLEFLTPIAKTYPAEMCTTSISNGLQVLGGYGFCMDFPLQQYYRDVRIMSLYEGTTGIQSLDLLGRKTTMKNGKALQMLTQEIMETIKDAHSFDELKPYANELGQKLEDTQEILTYLMPFAMKGEYERFLSDATMYMEFVSTVVIAWQWLKMATLAKRSLITGKKRFNEQFYESKIHTMKFYFKYELPKTLGLKETLLSTEVLTIVTEKELIC